MVFCILEDVCLQLGSLGQQQPSKRKRDFENRKSGIVGTVLVKGSFVAR